MKRMVLVGGLVLVTLFLGRLYHVPIRSVPDGPLPAALMAVAIAVGAWRFACRRRRY